MSFDWQAFLIEFGSNPFAAFWWIFSHGGVIIVYFFFVYWVFRGWYFWNTERYKHHRRRRFVTLAVDVPKENIQSMKAVENIFKQIYGAVERPEWEKMWWHGWTQEPFSFEIASHEGYIQFYIKTVDFYRDLVEASIYAQYPDAVITPVEDYSEKFNTKMFDRGEYDMFGSEMVTIRKGLQTVGPFKTYPYLEHVLTAKFVDPLGGLLEAMSQLGPGEHIWFQILAVPEFSKHWQEEGQKFIDTIAHIKKGSKKSILDTISDLPVKALETVNTVVFGGEVGPTKPPKEEPPSWTLYLTEPQKELIVLIDKKISQFGFRCKVRFIYLAKKEVFNPEKGRRTMEGAFYQFKGFNYFVRGHKTQTKLEGPLRFFFKKSRLAWRKRKLLRAYKSLDPERGERKEGQIFCTEELATIYHFPGIDIRAPFVKKAETKRIEPPHQLRFEPEEAPTEEEVIVKRGKSIMTEQQVPVDQLRGEPPVNLPIE